MNERDYADPLFNVFLREEIARLERKRMALVSGLPLPDDDQDLRARHRGWLDRVGELMATPEQQAAKAGPEQLDMFA